MLLNAMGLIIADNQQVHLGELNEPRSLAALPFGGRYRIIDFTLSSMVNSGIKQVGVYAMSRYRSLMDHLGTGASWDLDRMQSGLTILPPYLYGTHNTTGMSDLVGLHDFVRKCKQKYVVITESNMVANIDFEEWVNRHDENDADMTVFYNRDGMRFGSPTLILSTDRRGFVKDVLMSPAGGSDNKAAIGVVVMARDLLESMLTEAVARGTREFSTERLLRKHEQFRIRAYEHKGTILRINSVASYYQASMTLLGRPVREVLFNRDRPVYTKVKNEAPALYTDGNSVTNSLVSDGCRISGQVQDSILFRGVIVGRHAKLDHCIIMQNVQISEGVELSHVIIDKNSVVRMGVRMSGQPDYPFVIRKEAIV